MTEYVFKAMLHDGKVTGYQFCKLHHSSNKYDVLGDVWINSKDVIFITNFVEHSWTGNELKMISDKIKSEQRIKDERCGQLETMT